MTMMKKKMATNLAPATATLKPETRMENMELLLYLIQMGDTGEAGAKIFRKNAPSLATQCTICHRTQEAKEKAKVKKHGLNDSSAASEKVPAAKAIFRQSCIHDQVTYNKLCPRCVYPATVMGPR
jgi:hypothetical protein